MRRGCGPTRDEFAKRALVRAGYACDAPATIACRFHVNSAKLDDEHLAVNQRAPPLPRRLFAVAFCRQPILSSHDTMLGGFRALLRGSSALSGAAHDKVRAGERAHAIGALVDGPGPRQRDKRSRMPSLTSCSSRSPPAAKS